MSKKKNRKKAEQPISHPIKLSLQERHKRVWEALFYSHQRLDVLLIAMSGAGIYVCLETLKYLVSHNVMVNPIIKISAILLLTAIICNFLSQWCASRVHYNDYCISTIDFSCEEDKKDRGDYIQEIQNHECKISVYSKADKILSVSAIILMSLGLIGILVFFTITF